MAGWQDDIARQKRAEANKAKPGSPERIALEIEASAAEAKVNESLRKAGQPTKY